MGNLSERIKLSQANSFRLDEQFEILLANERQRPGTIAKLSASTKLSLGHYSDQRAAYLAANGGKLPQRRQETD